MSDEETLAVYRAKSQDYAQSMEDHAPKDRLIHAFIQACPKAGHVLDLGCGPGAYAAVMADAGLRVEAVDAVPDMVALVPSRPGISARVATFDEIADVDVYDGIWANFSLLHAPRADLPRHLAALKAALKPGGVFFMGMKTGSGGKRDSLGRFYTYYSKEELEIVLQNAGFTLRAHWTGKGIGLDKTPHTWIVIHANG